MTARRNWSTFGLKSNAHLVLTPLGASCSKSKSARTPASSSILISRVSCFFMFLFLPGSSRFLVSGLCRWALLPLVADQTELAWTSSGDFTAI